MKGKKLIRRRARLIRRWMMIAGAVLICCVFCGFTSHPDTQKYYTSVCVDRGDSLYGIADSYITEEYGSIDDYISEIKRINHMHSNHLETGNYLIIPYYLDIPGLGE